MAAVRAELQAVIDSQGAENARLVEQFKLLQQSHFGSRSERVDPSQLSLFNDVEAASDGAPDPSGGPDGCPAPPARPKARHGGPRKVDMSKLDYLLVTLGGSYARVKISWDGMDDPERHSREDLVSRLSMLRTAIRTGAAEGAKIWNATLPDRIFADSERTN